MSGVMSNDIPRDICILNCVSFLPIPFWVSIALLFLWCVYGVIEAVEFSTDIRVHVSVRCIYGLKTILHIIGKTAEDIILNKNGG